MVKRENTETIETDPIVSEHFSKPKEEKDRTRKSIFNVTINSDKDYYKMTDSEK